MTLLTMRGIEKSFGSFRALKGVDFDLADGEVHALVGENGAGKSTLMKVLSGVLRPDGGAITVQDRPVTLNGVADARGCGIVMVYQELALVPSLTVAENLFLGDLHGIVRYGPLRRRAAQLMTDIGLDIDPGREVGVLSIGEQQLVEIAGALARKGRILVLDEPTAALSAAETDRLFALIERVRREGVGVVYISHRLEEVFRIADRVTVLRDGELVGTRSVPELAPGDVVRMMVGRDVRQYQRARQEDGAGVLGTFRFSADGLEAHEIALRRGEIVGLAGVVGSGRSRVAETLFGLGGAGAWNDQPIRSPREAIRRGIMLVPADRKTQGLVLELAIRNNLSLATLAKISRLGVLDFRSEDAQARGWIERLSVRPPQPAKPVVELSGGNQQKIVIGKALAIEPKVLLLDEPTRGVDVGARAEIYDVIAELSGEGIGVLLSSSDTEELIGLADRILVFREGRVTAELAAPFRNEELVAHVTGAL